VLIAVATTRPGSASAHGVDPVPIGDPDEDEGYDDDDEDDYDDDDEDDDEEPLRV